MRATYLLAYLLARSVGVVLGVSGPASFPRDLRPVLVNACGRTACDALPSDGSLHRRDHGFMGELLVMVRRDGVTAGGGG